MNYRIERDGDGTVRIIGADSDGDPFEFRLDDDEVEDFLADMMAIRRAK